MPVDQSITKQNSSADRAELLTPGDSNWSSDGVPRQSLSPSPCPLSPTSKRFVNVQWNFRLFNY